MYQHKTIYIQQGGQCNIALEDEIKSWIGTPFKHQGRTKGVGVDCIGLILGVAKNLKLTNKDGVLLDKMDSLHYSRTGNKTELKQQLDDNFNKAEHLISGTICLFKFYSCYQHLGIFFQDSKQHNTLIHAQQSVGKVVRHEFANWEQRLHGIYSFN